MDEARRRDLKRQFKAREQREARERLGLSETQLRDLLDYLDEGARLGSTCERETTRVRQWLRAEGLAEEGVLTSLGEFGGHCDCMILANVRPHLFGWS